jgi:hypothetical protein
MIRAAATVLVVAAALAAAGCGERSPGKAPTASTPRLTDLHDISQLQRAFNKASDEPRLVVLVSPT